MDNDTQHSQKLKGMVQQIRDQARSEAQLLPPAIERLDLLQAQIKTLQDQCNSMHQQCQQLAQQQLLLMQRQEEQRALLMKIGQIATRTEKFLKEKKSWMPWSS